VDECKPLKTGKRCVSFAAAAGQPVVACTRTGSFSTGRGLHSFDSQLNLSRLCH